MARSILSTLTRLGCAPLGRLDWDIIAENMFSYIQAFSPAVKDTMEALVLFQTDVSTNLRADTFLLYTFRRRELCFGNSMLLLNRVQRANSSLLPQKASQEQRSQPF